MTAALWLLTGYTLGWLTAREWRQQSHARRIADAFNAGLASGKALARDTSRQELERHFQTGHRIGQHELRAFLATLPVEALAGWVHHPLHDPVRWGTLDEFAPRVVEVDQ